MGFHSDSAHDALVDIDDLPTSVELPLTRGDLLTTAAVAMLKYWYIACLFCISLVALVLTSSMTHEYGGLPVVRVVVPNATTDAGAMNVMLTIRCSLGDMVQACVVDVVQAVRDADVK